MREIEALYLDMIAAGRHYILIDNQYLTAHTIGEALAERLSEPGRIGDRRRPAAPESRLAQGDHDAAPPLKSHRPAGIEGLEEGTCIDVHSKVTIVDDEWLRVGSANVCNRSMGFDSECDLLLEARRRPDAVRAIRDFRNRFLAEHLGVAEERVATEIDAQGSMSATIDRLGSPQRTLKRLENFGVSETVVSLASIADPEQPVTIENLVAQFAPRTEIRMRGVRWLTFATAVVALTALAALWQFTPVADVITPGRVTHWAREFAGNVWAPLIVLAAYTPAAMVMFPRPLITLFAVVAFGPWLGFGYAMSGILISAFVTYVIGMCMDRGTVRRLAEPKLNRIIAVLQRRGIVALTALRLVPLAAFAIVGVVAGAIRVKLRDFMLATAFGMLPGTLAAAVFGDHLEVALRDPSEVNLWLVAAVLMGLGIATLLVRRWLLTTQLHGESTRA